MKITFTTLDDSADPTFNQLLGINNSGEIAGYFGIGSATHPNKGYTLNPPHGQGNYTNENFLGSTQTQVTGINSHGVTVGFWADTNGDNFGFVEYKGQYITALDPHAPASAPGVPTVEQFLGVNDKDIAVGFYNTAAGVSHGFTYDIATNTFSKVTVSGFSNVTATGINNNGDVSGFVVEKSGNDEGFLIANGKTTLLAGPSGAVSVQALGVNNEDDVVGSFTDAAGNTHGFYYNAQSKSYTTIDDPNANGMTVVNGLNDKGQLVGFYLDHAGNTDGMLVTLSKH